MRIQLVDRRCGEVIKTYRRLTKKGKQGSYAVFAKVRLDSGEVVTEKLDDQLAFFFREEA